MQKLANKRDMDLVRDLLLKIESGEKVFEITSDEESAILGCDPIGMSQEEAHKLEYHLRLLDDAGLIVGLSIAGGGHVYIERISWAGHDFLDSVRDEEIWKKTKEGATKIGGFTVEMLTGIAKAFLKIKAKELLGVEL
ncbi:DUF2513 domain-containing protein [Pseudovibrio sp. Tun.PSC04-5.I4]|uniref:DUF2513 domain-containing protein n=1 Tax=Pseudovibrio sp. Tun.PSC04-5.I4 TaxID=1798213 RepID=UPI0008809AA3|nr:DUF2513 domain-containing protein [Pseudovibrio sp. Tun.PSC04-5.I4]SDQ17177.1 Hypothetical protein SAMN04515695_0310 [Pseudovibrio sp. Tun.PSC04-5.I4]